MKVGDLVTIEQQKHHSPLGETDVHVGIIIDKPTRQDGMTSPSHYFIVLTNDEVRTIPYHLMEVQSEDR